MGVFGGAPDIHLVAESARRANVQDNPRTEQRARGPREALGLFGRLERLDPQGEHANRRAELRRAARRNIFGQLDNPLEQVGPVQNAGQLHFDFFDFQPPGHDMGEFNLLRELQLPPDQGMAELGLERELAEARQLHRNTILVANKIELVVKPSNLSNLVIEENKSSRPLLRTSKVKI